MDDLYNNYGAPKERVGVVFLILVLLAAAGYFLYNFYIGTKYSVPIDVAMRLDAKTQEIAKRLKNEPCNRSLAIKFVSSLTYKNEYSTVVSFIESTEKQCGKNDELLLAKFLAQKGNSNFNDALITANQIIENSPWSAQMFIWRGKVKKELNDFDGAFSDYRRGIYLVHDQSRVLFSAFYDYAKMAAKIGNKCEAASILRDYIVLDYKDRNNTELRNRIQDWQEEGKCKTLFGTGSVRIPYKTSYSSIIAPLKINGTVGNFIVDTGASNTALTKEFAEKAGIDTSPKDRITVQTANGKTWMLGGRAKSISVEEAKAQDVPLFIQTEKHSGFGMNIDGLLGLSFLGNFKFTVEKGYIKLESL